MAAFPFGPVVGFGLAAFTLTLPENLVGKFENLKPKGGIFSKIFIKYIFNQFG